MQNLPIELLDAIFSHFDKDPEVPDTHLRELRLLCKSFHKTLTPLAFRRLRLSQFNRDAFDNIVSLSQCPLAQYVTTFEYKVVEHLTPPDIHQVDALIQLDDSSPSDSTAQARHLLAYHRTYLAQADVLGTHFDVISLAKALPSFCSLKAITISPFTTPKMYRQHDSAPTRAFWGIIKALQLCEYDIESLTIDAWHPPTLFCHAFFGTDFWGWADDSASHMHKQQIINVVTNLTTLTLSNIPPMYRGPEWQECIRTQLLQHCVHLEDLTVEINDAEIMYRPGGVEMYEGHPTFCGILFASRFRRDEYVTDCGGCTHADCLMLPRLRALELRASGENGAYLDRVHHFLGAHRETLRSLTFKWIWLRGRHMPPRDVWKIVVPNWLIRLRKLEVMKLEGLRDRQGDPLIPEEMLRRWSERVGKVPYESEGGDGGGE